jgi:hypothetical protein
VFHPLAHICALLDVEFDSADDCALIDRIRATGAIGLASEACGIHDYDGVYTSNVVKHLPRRKRTSRKAPVARDVPVARAVVERSTRTAMENSMLFAIGGDMSFYVARA